MKYLGPLTCLGLEARQSPTFIFLRRHKYVTYLIELVGLQHSTPVETLLEINAMLQQDDGDLLPNPILYHRVVGNLLHLTITRP